MARNGGSVTRKSPRLTDVNIQASTEGAAIPRVYGRVRVAGQLLWATKFKETVVKSQQSGGGKGGPGVTETDIDYRYSISFAVGLCAGVVTKIGRVWADGNLIDISQFTTRFYKGGETQTFDIIYARLGCKVKEKEDCPNCSWHFTYVEVKPL